MLVRCLVVALVWAKGMAEWCGQDTVNNRTELLVSCKFRFTTDNGR